MMLGFLLAACGVKGNALPEGMEEDTVLEAGEEIVNELVSGEYETVYDRLREDVREQTSAQVIETLMSNASEKLGNSQGITDTLVTGVTDTDEPQAIAVIYCKYTKKSVMFRIAFDTDMELIGLEIKKK